MSIRELIDKIAEHSKHAEPYVEPIADYTKNLPERFKNIIRDGKVDESRISPVAKKYVSDRAWEKKRFLVLVGFESGHGKSFDASWVVYNYLVETKGKGFLWDMPERICSEMMESDYMMYAYKNSAFLIIDDFDKFKAGDGDNAFKKNLMHELIDYRMDIKMRPTIITANADRKTLEQIYTPYIVRRIFDASEGYRGIK